MAFTLSFHHFFKKKGNGASDALPHQRRHCLLHAIICSYFLFVNTKIRFQNAGRKDFLRRNGSKKAKKQSYILLQAGGLGRAGISLSRKGDLKGGPPGYIMDWAEIALRRIFVMHAFLVFQSDFGLCDGAVSAMKGVAYSVDPDLVISDITHEITPYNIFEASYRLFQTIPYWPDNTVFVSVVDPGVGTSRESVVARTSRGQYIVTPNNGTLTHAAAFVGIDQVRLIEERTNRLKNSETSYTFYGRDVYAYTGARLASGTISFEEVGPLMTEPPLSLELFGATLDGDSVKGQIDILDVRFGSLWTSIPFEMFRDLGISFGDYAEVRIYRGPSLVYINRITYGRSFADVMVGMPVLYMNSVGHMALAINQGSFARAYNIGTGAPWTIVLCRV